MLAVWMVENLIKRVMLSKLYCKEAIGGAVATASDFQSKDGGGGGWG